ncbi:MAG: recombination protein NinB [Proteobacteria bacterium]|nr:recombination protein NinB [Pseudomonadota bacterium]
MSLSKRTLVLAHDVARQRALQAVRDAPAGYVVTIQEPARNSLQNAFYWALLADISDQLEPDGKHFGPQTWHEHFKGAYLEPDLVELPNGKYKFVEPTTTKLGRRAFSNYVEQIMVWAVEAGVVFSEKTRTDEHAWRSAA